MAKIDVGMLQRTRQMQKAEDDDLYTDITKSRKLSKKQQSHDDADEPAENTAKDKRNLLILIFSVLAIILIFVAILIFYHPKKEALTIDELHLRNLEGKLKPEQGYMYGGFSFVKYGDLWYSQVRKDNTVYDVTFNYDPKSVENITVDGILTTKFTSGKHIYITFDPEGRDLKYVAVANFGLSRSLAWAFHYNMTAGCTKNVTSACQSAGVVNCGDTDKSVIYFKEANETKVELFDNCVTVQGTGAEIVRAKDRLLLRWYGIVDK